MHVLTGSHGKGIFIGLITAAIQKRTVITAFKANCSPWLSSVNSDFEVCQTLLRYLVEGREENVLHMYKTHSGVVYKMPPLVNLGMCFTSKCAMPKKKVSKYKSCKYTVLCVEI